MLEIETIEKLDFGNTTVGTIDLNNGVSIDVGESIVGIPDNMYELFIYKTNGSGSYMALEVYFKDAKKVIAWYGSITDNNNLKDYCELLEEHDSE